MTGFESQCPVCKALWWRIEFWDLCVSLLYINKSISAGITTVTVILGCYDTQGLHSFILVLNHARFFLHLCPHLRPLATSRYLNTTTRHIIHLATVLLTAFVLEKSILRFMYHITVSTASCIVCECKSHTGPNSVVSQISQPIIVPLQYSMELCRLIYPGLCIHANVLTTITG